VKKESSKNPQLAEGRVLESRKTIFAQGCLKKKSKKKTRITKWGLQKKGTTTKSVKNLQRKPPPKEP